MRGETSIGGDRRGFPTTLWSTVIRGGSVDPAERRRAMESLFARYWKPVYHAVVYGWNASSEDAKDLVQDFFLDLIERDSFLGLDPARGRFRAFLKAALRHFMLNARRDAGRLKRGGKAAVVPLDGHESCRAADQALDDAWARELLDRAVDRLRREAKPAQVRVFELYDLAQGEASYRSVAAETGLSESDVRNHLHAARTALRGIVRELIGEYASGAGEAEDEVRWILG